MVKKSVAIFLLVVMLFTAGCMGHTHIVGEGVKQDISKSQWQWYILWGLVPLNNVDTQALAGGAKDYEIKTKQSFLNYLVSIFTGIVTIYSRNVEVTR